MKIRLTRILSLMTAATILLSMFASAATQPSPFKLSGAKKVTYYSDEQKITFTDSKTVGEIVDFLNNSGAAKADTNPNMPMGVYFTVDMGRWSYEYLINEMPYTAGEDHYIFVDGGAYKTKADMGELIDMMQDKLHEADEYGRFYPLTDGRLMVLDNTARNAVAATDEDTAEIEKIHKMLNNLDPNMVHEDKRNELGKRLAGCSELRLTLVTGDTVSYQLYEKGVSVTRRGGKGAYGTEYYLCDVSARKEIYKQMKKLYDSRKIKNASWLAIINPNRVDSIKVSLKADKAQNMCESYIAPIIGELQGLQVGKATTVKAMWAKPDAEYRIGFSTHVQYRVQLLGGKMRISSSDMKEKLEYTLSKKEASELLAWTESQLEADRKGQAKANPMTAKPVIYLYPQEKVQINVKLDFRGTLTSTYPLYPEDGWTVTATPDGILTDGKGRSYRCLFWEGKADTDWKQESGCFVKADEAERFLERSLTQLGLNELEQNDFITYWLPKLQANGESFVSFAGQEYADIAVLNVEPKPDSVLRVQMIVSRVDDSNRAAFEKLPEQKLSAFKRKGFVLVEWGGTQL